LSSKAKKYSAKLSNKWSSLLLIARFLTGVTVQLANPETGVIVKKAQCDSFEEVFSVRISVGVCLGRLQRLSRITLVCSCFDLAVGECMHVSSLFSPTTRLRTNSGLCVCIFLCIQSVFKFHRQTSRACRWVQGTLRKISPSCQRRLIAEIQADEIPLPL
jgi:hypothetical protein